MFSLGQGRMGITELWCEKGGSRHRVVMKRIRTSTDRQMAVMKEKIETINKLKSDYVIDFIGHFEKQIGSDKYTYLIFELSEG